MNSYKVLIRVRELTTNKIIHNRKFFENYDNAVDYINKNLSPNNVIKIKFFENNKAFGYGDIFYSNNQLCNYDESLILLKKLLKVA